MFQMLRSAGCILTPCSSSVPSFHSVSTASHISRLQLCCRRNGVPLDFARAQSIHSFSDGFFIQRCRDQIKCSFITRESVLVRFDIDSTFGFPVDDFVNWRDPGQPRRSVSQRSAGEQHGQRCRNQNRGPKDEHQPRTRFTARFCWIIEIGHRACSPIVAQSVPGCAVRRKSVGDHDLLQDSAISVA